MFSVSHLIWDLRETWFPSTGKPCGYYLIYFIIFIMLSVKFDSRIIGTVILFRRRLNMNYRINHLSTFTLAVIRYHSSSWACVRNLLFFSSFFVTNLNVHRMTVCTRSKAESHFKAWDSTYLQHVCFHIA